MGGQVKGERFRFYCRLLIIVGVIHPESSEVIVGLLKEKRKDHFGPVSLFESGNHFLFGGVFLDSGSLLQSTPWAWRCFSMACLIKADIEIKFFSEAF